jgi:hypothetical protein
VAAVGKEDYHLPGPGARALRSLFRLETERVLSNDWVVRQANRFYQVERQSQHHAPAKSKVTVCEWEDGTTEIHYRGQKLKWKEIGGRAEARKREGAEGKEGIAAAVRKGRKVAQRPWRPGPEHPWRRSFGERGVDPAVVGWAPGGSAGVVGVALRFALSARPPGSQGFAPGKANDQKNQRQN